QDGTVVSGPPPRPLDELESRIEAGQLMILYQEIVWVHRRRKPFDGYPARCCRAVVGRAVGPDAADPQAAPAPCSVRTNLVVQPGCRNSVCLDPAICHWHSAGAELRRYPS